MNSLIVNFIRTRHIDSFQKLRFLLFLHQNPRLTGTCQQFAKRLYLGDLFLLEEIVSDLRLAGLVDCAENHCTLHDEPEIQSCLECLAKAFEDPLSRQEIFDQVRNCKSINHI
jgi:hypothetical protein